MQPPLIGPRKRIWHIALLVACAFFLIRVGIDLIALAWLQLPPNIVNWVHLLGGTSLAFLLCYLALRYRGRSHSDQISRLQALLVNQTHDAIITTDQGGFITTWNRGAEEMFGYSAADTAGKHVAILFPLGLERHKWLDVIAPVLDTGYNSVESKCTHRDGHILDTHIALSVLCDDQNVPIGMIGHLMDITARKQAERDREKLQEQLRQTSKMEAVGKLAGGVAHDFNNLLAIILGYSEILLYEAKELSNTDRERLHQIRRAGRRAASLTKQLLAFSRKQVLQPVVVDLNELLGELQKMLTRLIGANIRLKFERAGAACPVKVDPGQFEQVIVNLVVNARDAMPDGGEVEITCGTATAEQVAAASVPAGAYAMVTVRDTGCGMDDEVRAQIFEPFFTTKEVGKGTGFGLATVHGIVQQSGGHITVESKLGAGTTFRIFLPLARGQAGHIGEDLETVLPHGDETLLLVEDEAGIRRLAKEFLATRGYTVLEASNGEEALAAAAAHTGRIHLLITDMVMPGMPTRQLTEALRRERPETQVLYTSGCADVFVRDGIGEPEAFLQKPFTLHDLAQRVRERLDGKAKAREISA